MHAQNRTILSAVVGSRLHGTAHEASDMDLRGVFVAPLLDILSPFRTLKETDWLEGDTDNTSFELRKFCKMCAQGNPTTLEVLVGEPQLMTAEGEELRELLPAFLSQKCIEAFLGYAKNQERKFREDFQGRKWKYAAAEVRVLLQLRALLETGELQGTYDAKAVETLRAIRSGLKADAEIMAMVFDLERDCRTTPVVLADAPDIPCIEEFILRVYRE